MTAVALGAGTKGASIAARPRVTRSWGAGGRLLPTVRARKSYGQYGTSGATPATVSSWRLAAEVHALQLL